MSILSNFNLVDNGKIYGSEYKRIAEEPINKATLNSLNTNYPGEVFQGKYGLSCKLFIKGSTSSFVPYGIDTRSEVVPGQQFDISKVIMAAYQKDGEDNFIIKVHIPEDALLD